MFCPYCGIKNTADKQACFLCAKKLPSLDAEVAVAQRTKIVRRPPAESAPLRDRLLAALLDLLLVAAVLVVAAAALWSQVSVLRNVSRAIVIACAAGTAAIVLFGYTWLLQDATVGKAFTGIRVVRREQPLSTGRRIGVIAFWAAAVAGAAWGTATLLHLI
jgi:uncharacterized RDD family membrane protein YckC